MSASSSDPGSTQSLEVPTEQLKRAATTLDIHQLTHVGPYRILELVGEGGMGLVYKAEQTYPIRRIVALKLIKLGMDSNAVIARFESERQALALMNHPNVAKVLDAGTSETGRPYFVMEYVPGESITSFCDRHQYTTRQRLELFTQACEAVQHAHQKAVIHRDVKPSNILVMLEDGKPVVKVIDFGVAKATAQKLTERTLFTETGQLIGTPEYMSPEQAEMSALDIDTRSDIYSLGVVLYELLTGALPFDAESLRSAGYNEIQRIIREVDPPRPSTRLSSLGDNGKEVARRRQMQIADLTRQLRGELEWIPLKAMRKDRSQRYGTAAELVADIANYLEHRPLLAGPESARYRLRKFVRRNKGSVVAVTAVLLVLLLGIAATSVALVGQSRARAEAERQRAEAQRQAAEAERQTAIVEAVNNFQQDMLSAADPSKQLGDKVTVLQATEAAIDRLNNGAFKDQPRTGAAIRVTIGNTLRSLGQLDRAEPLLREAVEIQRANLPAKHRELATGLSNLGWLLRAQGKFTQAEPLLRESLEICQASLPETDPATLRAMQLLGWSLQDQGRLADAEQLLRRALELSRKSLPAGDPKNVGALNGLGLVLRSQGRYAEAEPLLREALAINRATLPPGHTDLIASNANLAMVLVDQDKFAEAEPHMRESLAIARKSMPAGHTLISMVTNNLAWVLREQGKLAEAETMYRDALQGLRSSLPAGHPGIAQTESNLALVLRDESKFAEAEQFFRDALVIYRKALPGGNPNVADCLGWLAIMLEDQGRFDEAEPLIRESLEIDRRCLPAEHPDIATTLLILGELKLKQNRPDEAEPLAREGFEMREKLFSAGDWRRAAAAGLMGEIAAAQKKFQDAEKMILTAQEIIQHDQSAPADQQERAIARIIKLYEQWGKRDEFTKWRAELARLSATTAPATTPSKR